MTAVSFMVSVVVFIQLDKLFLLLLLFRRDCVTLFPFLVILTTRRLFITLFVVLLLRLLFQFKVLLILNGRGREHRKFRLDSLKTVRVRRNPPFITVILSWGKPTSDCVPRSSVTVGPTRTVTPRLFVGFSETSFVGVVVVKGLRAAMAAEGRVIV